MRRMCQPIIRFINSEARMNADKILQMSCLHRLPGHRLMIASLMSLLKFGFHSVGCGQSTHSFDLLVA